MLIMLKLCNFGTIYLWLFVMKVLLQVCAGQRMLGDGEADAEAEAVRVGPVLMKPLPYQMFDYMDELLKTERNGRTLWQTPTKDKQHPADFERLHFAIQPKTGSGFEEGGGVLDAGSARGETGHSMANTGITLENLNDFDILNAIWPSTKSKDNNKIVYNPTPYQQQQQQQLRHRLRFPSVFAYQPRYTEGNPPYSPDKRTQTSWLAQLSKAEEDYDNNEDEVGRNSDNDNNDAGNVSDEDMSKTSAFPLAKAADDTLATNTNTVISTFNTGKGNENSNYSDNNNGIVRGNNYSSDTANGEDKNRDTMLVILNRAGIKKRAGRLRKKKPKQETATTFVPAISAGAMTNLGKFFRDLSKNVQFSEKYQWSAEDQKLLEGDPTFSNLHHHLSEPHVTGDHAGEWIKAIRFYRPSQKIRSLVEMNPHGQWAHGSHFIDPNYMWMGLGK